MKPACNVATLIERFFTERLMRQHCGKASAYMVALLAASPSGASGASSVAARRKINSVVR